MGKPVINIKFLADLKQFSTGMQNATRRMDKLGRKMQNVGAGLTAGVTLPIIAMGAASVKSYDIQAKAIAQVEAGLLSTKNAVGLTSKELQDMASELQNNSLFGDEDILSGVTAQLLTFTNIAKSEFGRTSQIALDLSTRLGTDLKSSSILLGKALNDPVANLSALSRAGIQFTKDQKDTIASLVAGGKAAEAQSLILDELEKQYGGSAAAAAKAGTGPFKQLSNTLGDISEEFGAIIVEGLLPFVEKLKAMAAGFQNLSPETKKFIAILAGVAAAAGPLLALAGTILPAIGTGMALLTGPIGLIVAGLTAVGVVISKNWAPIKQTLTDIANYFIDLYNESTVFRIGVEGIISVFKNLYSLGAFIFNALGTIISAVANNIKEGFAPLGELFKALLTGDLQKIPVILAAGFKQGIDNAKGLVGELGAEFEVLKDDISKNVSEGIQAAMNGKRYKLPAENVDVSEVAEKLTVGPDQTGATVGTPQTEKLETAAIGVVNPLGPISEQLTASKEIIVNALDGTIQKFTAFQEAAASIGDSVGGAFEDMSFRLVDSLGLADDGFEGFAKGLVGTVTKLIAMMLSQSIAQSIAGATASGTATGPLAIFTTPAFIATAVGGVLAAFAAIPKFATGGIVGGSSFYGDQIFARLNSGEMVLNKNQQRDLYGMLGSKESEVYIADSIVRGDDIVISYRRSESKNNRIS